MLKVLYAHALEHLEEWSTLGLLYSGQTKKKWFFKCWYVTLRFFDIG